MSDENRVNRSGGDAVGGVPIVVIAQTEPHDVDELTSLLNYYNLSTARLNAHLATTLVARVDQHVVGSAALEVYGTAALLISVAVAPHVRGRRLAECLTLAALDLARERGVAFVYLLAESSGYYFLRFGFTSISREELPPPLYQSVKQQPGRSATALVLVKRITTLQ